MPRLARGRRDGSGRWHPDDPGEYPPMGVAGTLPWSVLRQDSRTWQDRKRWWAERGVVDDVGPRAGAVGMVATGRHGRVSAGVSRFDPHLAEVLYTWFCPPGGRVVDPCAGGPVRGMVAAHLGLAYLGVDLSAGQVAANRAVARGHAGDVSSLPSWVCGDSAEVLTGIADGTADYVLTCPPYHNRERYSNDPRDLSVMRWAEFADTLRWIVAESVRVLRPDRFCTWVISDVRDHRGHLRGLPALTAQALRDAGAPVVNEQVLVAPAGTLAKTMRPAWEACRTVTRVHQVVLTAVKGDRRVAAACVAGCP